MSVEALSSFSFYARPEFCTCWFLCWRWSFSKTHCAAPSCRYLQCRSAQRICTFTGLPHQHWKHSGQNNQTSLSPNMPHYLAVFVSDCLRHSVTNITVSRLSSLVSSCLDSGSTTAHMWWDGGGTHSFARREGEQQQTPKVFFLMYSCHPQHVHTCLGMLPQRHDCCSVAVFAQVWYGDFAWCLASHRASAFAGTALPLWTGLYQLSLWSRWRLFHRSRHLLSGRYSGRDTFTSCLAVVFGRSSTTTQFSAIATISKRCHHSRLMTLPDVGPFNLPTLKMRTCGTTVYAWDTNCKVQSSPHLMEMFMRNFVLNTPLSLWPDRKT